MIDKKFIEQKLEIIESYCQETDKIFKFSLDEIRRDFLKYRAAERLLQLIIDEMIDINNHLTRRVGLKVADDFQSGFLILAENDILPHDFAERIAPVVGLRNRLVHRYEKIDLNLFLEMMQKEKQDFREYIKLIYGFLKTH